LFAKWNPKNHYFIFFLLAFFLIRVREPAPLSGFLGRGYLASYLAFLPKSRHFCPKTGDFAYFRTYIVFLLWSSIIPTHIVQNQRTNQPVSALVITILPFQRLTRNQFDSNVTWVRIPPSAPKAAPCGALLFIFAANYARAARWDSNSPRPALCVPPGCNSPADCCKGAGESHRLRQVSLLNFTLGSDFFIAALQNPRAFLIDISPLFSSSDFRVRYKSYH
jgi:hypothetical protein